VAPLKPLLALLVQVGVALLLLAFRGRARLLLLAFRERARLLLLALLVPVRVAPSLLALLQQRRVCWLDCRRRRSSRRRLCRHILAAHRPWSEGVPLGRLRCQGRVVALLPLLLHERTRACWRDCRRRRSSRRRWCRYILAAYRSS